MSLKALNFFDTEIEKQYISYLLFVIKYRALLFFFSPYVPFSAGPLKEEGINYYCESLLKCKLLWNKGERQCPERRGQELIYM